MDFTQIESLCGTTYQGITEKLQLGIPRQNLGLTAHFNGSEVLDRGILEDHGRGLDPFLHKFIDLAKPVWKGRVDGRKMSTNQMSLSKNSSQVDLFGFD